MSLTDQKIREWGYALQEAQRAADAVSKPEEDCGTTNMDTVVIDFCGWYRTSVYRLERECGIDISEKIESGWFRGSSFIYFRIDGTASNRTRMMEAACNKLKALGVPASMWYKVD